MKAQCNDGSKHFKMVFSAYSGYYIWQLVAHDLASSAAVTLAGLAKSCATIFHM